VVECTVDPLVPVIVTVYCPALTPEPTVNVAVELPDPVIDAGLNDTVTPLGCPDALSVTAELNPPEAVVVTVELPVLPAFTDTEVAEMEKSGFCVVPEPVSALTSAGVGLPHPVTRSYPVTAE
jgi:hypothetical protein